MEKGGEKRKLGEVFTLNLNYRKNCQLQTPKRRIISVKELITSLCKGKMYIVSPTRYFYKIFYRCSSAH